MMAPMAPGVGEECWEVLCTQRGWEDTKQPASVFREKWPVCDERALVTNKMECVVQINGKTRFTLLMSSALLNNPSEIERLVKESESGAKWVEGKIIKKVIHAKRGQLVNFLCK